MEENHDAEVLPGIGSTASVPVAVVSDATAPGIFAPVGVPVIGEPVASIDPTTISRLETACGDLTRLTTYLEALEAKQASLYAQMMAQVDPVLRDEMNRTVSRISEVTAQRGPHEAFIRAAVLNLGKTFKYGRVTAVWNDGRESADIPMLKGMAAFYPQIKNALKKGEPSVSIRVK